jgi:hypothetical protein
MGKKKEEKYISRKKCENKIIGSLFEKAIINRK